MHSFPIYIFVYYTTQSEEETHWGHKRKGTEERHRKGEEARSRTQKGEKTQRRRGKFIIHWALASFLVWAAETGEAIWGTVEGTVQDDMANSLGWMAAAAGC